MSESVYEEVSSMLEISQLIYHLAYISKWDDLEKDYTGKLADKDFLDPENLPHTSSEMEAWYTRNKVGLGKSKELNVELDTALLHSITQTDSQNIMAGEATLEKLDTEYAFIEKKSDEQGEIVYGITRNPDKKRITVTFRGSQIKKDWFQNFKFGGEDIKVSQQDWASLGIPNPNTDLLAKAGEVEIHRGFFQYLFVQKQQQEDKSTKFQEIMREIFALLTKAENKDYSVYFTGHSLGAALATLAAAATAISRDIKKPVKLITLASPHVGKFSFVQAFWELEKAGCIQHLRVTNGNDPVPQVLDTLGYRHTGIHLNLYTPILWSDEYYRISKSHTGWMARWNNGMNKSYYWKFAGPHALTEYQKRLDQDQAKKELLHVTLDQLYKDPKNLSYEL